MQSPAFAAAAERLVLEGGSHRGLPSCVSCHGTRAGGLIETPTLTNQHREYLEAQFRAYASGERRNDVYQRMRSIAQRLTSREIELLATYYATQR